jgi:AcrR family transcriptional regulator
MADDKKIGRGRPRSTSAASHDAILDAVYDILQEKSVRDLTIEEVARRAQVGKPTIYKWWASKATLVLDMIEERMVEAQSAPTPHTAEELIRTQVTELIQLLNGFFGKVAAGIIAEGQSDPEVLEAYRERYLRRRRALTKSKIEQAQANGEFAAQIDADLLIDMIYGPIYYRFLIKHQTLDQEFANALVDHILASLKS